MVALAQSVVAKRIIVNRKHTVGSLLARILVEAGSLHQFFLALRSLYVSLINLNGIEAKTKAVV